MDPQFCSIYLHGLFVYPYLFDYFGIIVGLKPVIQIVPKIQNIFGYSKTF